jgi:outer membrane protein TolC
MQPTKPFGSVGAGAPAQPAPVAPGSPAPPAGVAGNSYRLTLEGARQRVLTNNKLLALAAMNAQGKGYAVRAAQADYFPKVFGEVVYFHFSDFLGSIITGGGRTITGPRGATLTTLPTFSKEAAVLNQDSSWSVVGGVQPITDLLKVRQGVNIARADEQIAHAQQEKAARELVTGVEQLYWGLLAAERIQAGALEGVRVAELLAKAQNTVEVRTALLEARQALQQVEKQVADVREQLNNLIDLPTCTLLELVEPPLPVLPLHCADEAIGFALAAIPEVREAEQTILKARAAVAAAKVDYLPNVAAVGGYLKQTGMSYVQEDIGYVGVIGSYTLVDWGKRRNTLRERDNLVAMATLKLEQTRDEVRQNVGKAFREYEEDGAAVTTAREMVGLRKEALKKASTPEALRDPASLLKVSKDVATAEVDLVKAELAYRAAYVKLMSLIGKL